MNADGIAAEAPAEPLVAPPAAPSPELGPDETIINPHYMMQLLVYGLRMGQQSDVEWNEETLMKEGEVSAFLLVTYS